MNVRFKFYLLLPLHDLEYNLCLSFVEELIFKLYKDVSTSLNMRTKSSTEYLVEVQILGLSRTRKENGKAW